METIRKPWMPAVLAGALLVGAVVACQESDPKPVTLKNPCMVVRTEPFTLNGETSGQLVDHVVGALACDRAVALLDITSTPGNENFPFGISYQDQFKGTTIPLPVLAGTQHSATSAHS